MRLYIHIPFCASKCGYCGFASFANKDSSIATYISALCADLDYHLSSLSNKPITPKATLFQKTNPPHNPSKNIQIDSIFVGGGTPSLLDVRLYERIFEAIVKNAKINKDCEITFEANINHLKKDWCEGILSLGANRLSVGIQSFNEKKLRFLERDHSIKDIQKRIGAAYNAGFRNIGCDLIIDTSLDSPKVLKNEVKEASKLPLTHISAYSLSIDEGSRFYQLLQSARPKKRDSSDSMESINIEDSRSCADSIDKNSATSLKNAKYASLTNAKTSSTNEGFSKLFRSYLGDIGFMQYEVSNYAKIIDGNLAICAHNMGYWQNEEYLGCGLGAVSRINNIRSRANQTLDGYIKNPLARKKEKLSRDDLALERLMLGLRCIKGAKITKNLALKEVIQTLVGENICLLKKESNNIFLIANELFLCDEIALWLLKRLE